MNNTTVNMTAITLCAEIEKLAVIMLVATLVYASVNIIGKIIEYKTARLYASLAKDLSEAVSLELLAKSLHKLSEQFEDIKITKVARWSEKRGVRGATARLMFYKNFNRVELNRWVIILIFLIICLTILKAVGG